MLEKMIIFFFFLKKKGVNPNLLIKKIKKKSKPIFIFMNSQVVIILLPKFQLHQNYFDLIHHLHLLNAISFYEKLKSKLKRQ